MILTCTNLKLNTESKEIFGPISLSLLPGSITKLSGKNGSGKTSFLKMISGLISTNSDGEVLINDISIKETEKPYLTYIAHESALYDQMSVIENLEFWASCYNSEILIPAALNYFGLSDIADIKCSELSAGNKQKLSLARLICCESNIWLLDEPEVNLDEENKRNLYNLISVKANNGGIIIMTSHHKLPFEKLINIEF